MNELNSKFTIKQLKKLYTDNNKKRNQLYKNIYNMLSKKIKINLIKYIKSINNNAPFDINLDGKQLINITLYQSNNLSEDKLKEYLPLKYYLAPKKYNIVYLINVITEYKNVEFVDRYLIFVCDVCNVATLINYKDSYDIDENSLNIIFDDYTSLNEMNVTGNIAGYNTPNAFSNSKNDHKKRSKKHAELTGYTLVNEEKIDLKEFIERDDEDNRTPRQKMKDKLFEINRNLKQLDNMVKEAVLLKTKNEFKTIPRQFQDMIKRIDNRIDKIKREMKHFNL